MIDLKGHKALITGSRSGVGKAFAIAFAQAGADVLVHGRSADDTAMAVVNECRKCGVRSEFVSGDLSAKPYEAVDLLFAAATNAMPGIDILVNNAGWFRDVAFEQMTPERFEQTMSLNVTAPYFLTQKFARMWIEKKVHGRVLITGSINGRLAEERSTAYDISKGAVEMMVKTLAVALAKHNIRVNGVAPGLVHSNATSWLHDRPVEAKWLAYHTPNGQIPDASVCGPAAVYMCSDSAEHVTGQMLLVDGGMSAWQQPRPMTP
jgi:NAD(P)-dependent dehydrogenase (short-subunit alcohol dehydrogenase family)